MDDLSPPAQAAFGRYQLLELIGRGGMAEVFKAKSFGVEGFEKVIVIKRILPELAAHPKFVEMFVREAKLAVRLSHANIVQVFDLGRLDLTPNAAASDAEGTAASYFIAMEYVAGVDVSALLERLRRDKRELPLGAAVHIAQEVAKALDHAHRRRDEQGELSPIVHRDISPHNILLSWEGDVKVTDFGIARAADSIDAESDELQAARVSGKVSFMSPEQARSEPTDARSDLFSLGAVLYEMIAGANPFRAPTVAETVRRICAGEYPPIALARPDAPTELCAIVDGLLSASIDERISDAASLSKELRSYSYTADERFGAADFAALLTPLRDRIDEAPESVLEDHSHAEDRTPVEVPHTTSPPPPGSGAPSTRQAVKGERREVTMLLLATHASTSEDEPLSPRIREVLDRHGAWIEEQSRERIVALFGLGDTDGRDAEAAVRAALVLVRQRSDGAVPSVGIHSGAISVDDGGLPVHDERLTSLLNTAQALARSVDGNVAISPIAGRLVRRSFVTEPLAASLHAVTDGGLRVRRALADAQQGRFVGRQEELKRLGAIMAAATRKGQQLAVVRGPSGVGKSRLIREAERRLEHGRFNVAFYAARCPLHGASVPWSGLRAMLHELCGTELDDDPERITEVRPRLAALGLSEGQAEAVLELLGGPQQTPASETRARLRSGFERMVRSLCNDRLHCLTWDDAQALDRETLDLILRIMRRGRPLRSVFILAQRGELAPALTRRNDVQLLDLGELHEKDTAKLIEWRLGARSIPKPLLSYVQSCAGGHPLFIDELLRELCEKGSVQVMNGNIHLGETLQATAPRPLRTLVADRVSRLPQRDRLLLQSLAIVGEPALVRLLSSVMGQAMPNLDRLITDLTNRDFLTRIGPSQVRFASPLHREIVLDAMAPAVRRKLHERAAYTYDRAELAGTGEAAERVADHLLGAGRSRRAIAYFWKSANQRLARGQLEGALLVMIRAMQIAKFSDHSTDELLGWLSSVAHTVDRVRQASGLRDLLKDLLRHVDDRGDATQRIKGRIATARALGAINQFDDAYRILDAVNVDDLEDGGLERDALSAMAELATRQGSFARAIEAGEKLDALGELDDQHAFLALVVARAMSGQFDTALEMLDRLDASSKPRDPAEQVTRLKHRMLALFNARRFEEAARHASNMAKIANSAGLRYDAASGLHNLGDICDRMGDHPKAYAAFVESLELTRQIEHDRLGALNEMHLCLLDGLRNPEGAAERLKSLIRQADSNGYVWDVLEGRYLLARLLAAHGDHAGARQLLQTLVGMADEHRQLIISADARDMLAKLGDE